MLAPIPAGYPNANDLTTWDLALQAAPQLSGIRLGYASAMMQAHEFENAAALLIPLANSPHGGSAATTAQALLERAHAGLPPPSDDELEAAVEEAARQAEPEPQPEAGPTPPPGDAPSDEASDASPEDAPPEPEA